MTVSERMAKGIVHLPNQCHGQLWGPYKGCAVGTLLHDEGASQAIATSMVDGQFKPYREIGRWLRTQGMPLQISCSFCSWIIGDSAHAYNEEAWASIVYHLNDDHRWPREQIASWVDEKINTALAANITVATPTPVPAAATATTRKEVLA